MKFKKLLIVSFLVLALPLSTASKCAGGSNSPSVPGQGYPDPVAGRPGCPDITFRADYERCFTLQTFVESRLGPYDVYLEIRGGEGVYPKEIPQAGGGWKHSIVYRSGKELSIKLTLRYEGEESKDGFCSITDGNELYKQKLKSIRAEGGSPYQAVCGLTTSQ